MNNTTTAQKMGAIFTLVIGAASLFGVGFGIFGVDNAGNHMYGLSVVSAVLAAIAGYMSYNDYKTFFGNNQS